MNPLQVPVAEYATLPAPLWLITVLHVLTLTLHFVAMNLMVGGVLIILFGGFPDRWNNPVVRRFVKLFPTAMAATISLGVAPLLFVQLVYGQVIYSAAIVSGWFWLMIIAAVIVAYYFLYAGAFSMASAGSRTGIFLTLALVSFLYISFVYSSVFSLAERPALNASLYAAEQSGLAINSEIGSYLFRWLHMLLGAVTVGGFFVGLLGRNDERAFIVGKHFYLWGMVAAMVVGLVYLVTLGEYLGSYMRSSGIWFLLVSFVLSLGSLHFFFKQRFWIAGSMLFVSLLGMVANRHVVRLIVLDGQFDPAHLVVRPQWGLFIVFVLCFLIALAMIAYMLRLFFVRKQAG